MEAADDKAKRNADQRGQAKTDADALQRGQNVPADAHVVRPFVVEGFGKQLDSGIPCDARGGDGVVGCSEQCPQQNEKSHAEHGWSDVARQRLEAFARRGGGVHTTILGAVLQAPCFAVEGQKRLESIEWTRSKCRFLPGIDRIFRSITHALILKLSA